MRPLFRALFVFSIFGVIAAHISNGFLESFASEFAPMGVAMMDRYLTQFLVGPYGVELSIYIILGVGTFFALWAYMAGKASAETGTPERYSTW